MAKHEVKRLMKEEWSLVLKQVDSRYTTQSVLLISFVQFRERDAIEGAAAESSTGERDRAKSDGSSVCLGDPLHVHSKVWVLPYLPGLLQKPLVVPSEGWSTSMTYVLCLDSSTI